MSIVKYRVRDVASDFGIEAKDISQIVAKFFEKPRSNMQILTEEQLNCVFDYLTQKNPISSIDQVFASTATQKKEEKPASASKPHENKPAQKPTNENRFAQKPAAKGQSNNNNRRGQQNERLPRANEKPDAKKTEPKAEAKPAVRAEAKPEAKAEASKEPQRKRERRVVDTSAVTVNAERFDDRVDVLVSEREQNFTGGKQRIGGKGSKKKQVQKKGGKFVTGSKSKFEEQEKMRRLQLEIAKKAPLTVKIPDEITVGELASRMKKTAAEVIKCLLKTAIAFSSIE